MIAALLAAFGLAFQAQDPLASLKKLQCTFPVQAIGTWVDGAPKADVKAAKLSVGFDAIDVGGGTADTVGQFGPLHITVRLTGSTVHFLHMDSGGALYLTTVFAPGKGQLEGGKLRAVHTRHEYTEVSLPGFTSRPEQYYGDCTPSY
jgi:hypothetical protein